MESERDIIGISIRRISALQGGDEDLRSRIFPLLLACCVFGEVCLDAVRPGFRIAQPLLPEFVLCVLFMAGLWFRRTASAALWCVFLVAAAAAYRKFPFTGNHAYLLALTSFVTALFGDRSEEDRVWRLGMVRLMFIITVFYTGLQKVLHGHYFRGETLSFYVAHVAEFRRFFSLFLPREEVERLTSYAMRPGDGPYRFTSPVGMIMTNMTWITEMFLPLGLLFRPTMRWAAAGLAVTVFMIELAAREWLFGIYFAACLLLFAPDRLMRPALVCYLAFSAWLLLMRGGLFPEVAIH